jgi:small conductance mechanosensitive channel
MPFNSEQLGAWAELGVNWGLQIVGAVGILILGWVVAAWVGRTVRRIGLGSDRIDDTVSAVLGRVVRWVILLVTMVAVLNRFGVETTSIVALLGAAGLAIGLALQGALSNIAAGVMLLSLRPFKLGDAVDVAGTAGSVVDIGLFVTRLKTFDGVAVHLPNSKVWGQEIKNFSQNPTRRVDMTFGIGYDDDVEHAMRVIEGVLEQEPRLLPDPAPVVAIASLGDSSVNIMVRPWVERADFFGVKIALTKQIKERFDAEGISIPFPQRDIHVITPDAALPGTEESAA